MKIVRILMLAFLLAAIIPICHADVPDEKLHKKCLYPIVMVEHDDGKSLGTGVIVRSEKIAEDCYENVFISCAHIISKGYFHVWYFTYENHSYIKGKSKMPCQIQILDIGRDLAVGVFLSKTKLYCAEVDINPQMFIGNDVSRIGCGLGDEPRLDFGKITSCRTQIGNGKDMIRTSVHTVSGDSGSPLYNNERKVIGILVSIRHFEEKQMYYNISYAVPVSKFKALSDDCEGALSFIWDETSPLPKMPVYHLKFFRENEIAPSK